MNDSSTDDPNPEANPPTSTPDDPDSGFTAAENEIVSAVLDAEATAEERAAVLGDSRLAARLEEFATVRDQVASSTPIVGEDRERAIQEALAAGSVTSIAGARATRANIGPGAPRVAGLQHHRLRPHGLQHEGKGRHWAWIATAAAAVIIVVGLVFAGSRDRNQTDDSTASARESSANAQPEASKDSAAGSAGDLAVTTTTAGRSTGSGVTPSSDSRPRIVLQLGSFASRAELVSTYSMAVAGRTLAAGPDAPVAPCPSSTEELSELASAVVGTTPVVIGTSVGGTVTVVDAGTCAPLPPG